MEEWFLSRVSWYRVNWEELVFVCLIVGGILTWGMIRRLL